ncbi:MAG: DUF499 domain-containing protein [Candidatus Hodarchaeales archaeon]
MKSWYEIVTPHSLIQSGQFKESFFVADLGEVIQGTAPSDYSNSQNFFQKTFLTKGLLRLLDAVHLKLCKKEGSEIIKLQTPFGGGKTHALITIYHFVTMGTELKEFLPENLSPLKTNVATIVGTNLNPLEGKKIGKSQIFTLWGDIVYQLAGERGFNDFKANDSNRITPGKEKLKNFFREHEPFILLIDELAEYVNKARGVAVNDSNLGTQTLLFLQELTEALASLSQSILIITLPVYKYEDFSVNDNSFDTLNQMNRILGRVEITETPIDRNEIYRLFTKRLIKEVHLHKDRDEIISNYLQIYQEQRIRLPERVTKERLTQRMKDSYPFHPELIDLLYDKWGKIPSFQGMRGIFRVLTRILSFFWSSKEQIELILPVNIGLKQSLLQNEFLRHIEAQFREIIDIDFIGENSNASSLDIKLPSLNNMASKISKLIFLNSFAMDDHLIGLNLEELRLNLIESQTPISLISDAINHVYQSLFHLHFKDGRYFFSSKPNLNRKIQDIKGTFDENFEEEMIKDIKKHLGSKFRAIVWPQSSNEIPDKQSLTIVIVHPLCQKSSLNKWLKEKGVTFRQYQNTLIFAIPDTTHFFNFQDLIQEKLALQEIKETITRRAPDQDIVSEIKLRQNRMKESISFNLRKTYSIIFDGTSTISLGLPQTTKESLTGWYHRELKIREFIVSKLHYQKLIDLFFKDSTQYISTQQILSQFYINQNMFKIESSDVIRQTIRWGVEEGAFGIAIFRNNKVKTDSFKFSGKISPSEITFGSDEILLNKKIAVILKEKFLNNNDLKTLEIPKKSNRESISPIAFKTTLDTHKSYHKSYSLSFNVLDLKPSSFIDFYRGVLVPLESKEAEVSIEIKLEVKSKQEIPETLFITTIKETINQLNARITQVQKK